MELVKPHAGEAWARLASGIEAGIVGGLAMLALLLSESLVGRPRVVGGAQSARLDILRSARLPLRPGHGHAVRNRPALRHHRNPGRLFGLAFGGIQQRGRLVLLGLLAAVGWYNLANVTLLAEGESVGPGGLAPSGDGSLARAVWSLPWLYGPAAASRPCPWPAGEPSPASG